MSRKRSSTMQPPEKKVVRSLEKGLMKALVDPPDGDQRRRYVKKWIYGELKPSRSPKSIRQRIKEVLRK